MPNRQERLTTPLMYTCALKPKRLILIPFHTHLFKLNHETLPNGDGDLVDLSTYTTNHMVCSRRNTLPASIVLAYHILSAAPQAPNPLTPTVQKTSRPNPDSPQANYTFPSVPFPRNNVPTVQFASLGIIQ